MLSAMRRSKAPAQSQKKGGVGGAKARMGVKFPSPKGATAKEGRILKESGAFSIKIAQDTAFGFAARARKASESGTLVVEQQACPSDSTVEVLISEDATPEEVAEIINAVTRLNQMINGEPVGLVEMSIGEK